MPVSSTKNTNHYNRDESAIYSLKSRNSAPQNSSQEKNISLSSQSSDHIELSGPALSFLQKATENTENLLKKNPQYQSYLQIQSSLSPKNPLQKAISSITRIQNFLADPHNMQLSQNDPAFANFYEKVHTLMQINQQAVERAQIEIRTANSPTYHYLVQK